MIIFLSTSKLKKKWDDLSENTYFAGIMKHEFQKGTATEPPLPYNDGETELLRAALKRSYTERFEMMTRLMKMNIMLKKAKIQHKSIPNDTHK